MGSTKWSVPDWESECTNFVGLLPALGYTPGMSRPRLPRGFPRVEPWEIKLARILADAHRHRLARLRAAQLRVEERWTFEVEPELPPPLPPEENRQPAGGAIPVELSTSVPG